MFGKSFDGNEVLMMHSTFLSNFNQNLFKVGQSSCPALSSQSEQQHAAVNK